MDTHDFPMKCFTLLFSMSDADFKMPGARQIEQLLTVAIGFFRPKAASGLLVACWFGRLSEKRQAQYCKTKADSHGFILPQLRDGSPGPLVLDIRALIPLPPTRQPKRKADSLGFFVVSSPLSDESLAFIAPIQMFHKGPGYPACPWKREGNLWQTWIGRNAPNAGGISIYPRARSSKTSHPRGRTRPLLCK